MTPLYFSVDCEFTDANVYQGRLMAVALVCVSGQSTQHLLPVSTDARVSQWVLQNQLPLLQGSYLMEQRTTRLPKLQVGGRWLNPQVVQTASMIQQFVRDQRRSAFQRAHGRPPAGDELAQIPAVMVTWSGGPDWAYLSNLFGMCNLDNPFHYEMVDIAGLAMALLPSMGIEGWNISEAELHKALNLEPLSKEKRHNALEDARHQLQLFMRLIGLRELLLDPSDNPVANGYLASLEEE